MSGHVVSLKIYYAIFATLLTMTGLTMAVAFVNLGALNIYVAMSIAIFKALLVVLYFMHLRYSESLVKLFVASGIVWFAIMISFTVSDYYTRHWQSVPTGWSDTTAPASAPPHETPAAPTEAH